MGMEVKDLRAFMVPIFVSFVSPWTYWGHIATYIPGRYPVFGFQLKVLLSKEKKMKKKLFYCSWELGHLLSSPCPLAHIVLLPQFCNPFEYKHIMYEQSTKFTKFKYNTLGVVL